MRTARAPADCGEVRPAHPCRDHDRDRDRPEHQRGAEVLQEDETGWRKTERQDPDRPLSFGATSGPVNDKSGQGEDEQNFAQFGRLEGEEWKFE